MTRVPILAASLILAVSTGCHDLVSPDNPRSQLDTNRQKWRARGITSYSFTIDRACFCLSEGPVRVSVDRDSVVSVVRLDNSPIADSSYRPSVESLFDFIDDAIGRHAAVLRVTYDPTLGYPASIMYDGDLGVADDEVTFRVSDFAVAITTLGRPDLGATESRRPLRRVGDQRPP